MRKVKLSLLILSLIMLIVLSCGCLVLFARQDMNKKIITTNFAIYDVCRELMGDDEEILLLGEGVDMHSYQPTAHDIVNIANGELFIHIGGEGDAWVSDVLETSKNDDMTVVTLIDSVELICAEDHEEEEDHHHHHDHHEHTYDEHIWLSMKNMTNITNIISETLISCYPEKSHVILKNTKDFITQLEILDSRYREVFTDTANVVIADRFPFTYLFNDYNINHYSLFTGCSAETEASPETIASFINKVNSLDINYIYTLENSNSNNAKKIIDNSDCKDGVEILTLNSMQTINKDKIEKSSYIKIMYDNLTELKKVM